MLTSGNTTSAATGSVFLVLQAERMTNETDKQLIKKYRLVFEMERFII
jgi:hypothetical protein